MASSGAQSIAIDECMSLEAVGEIARQNQIGFIGNLHVTATLFEERENILVDVERCLKEGQPFPGYVFGLGGPLTQRIPARLLQEAATAFQARKLKIR